ncbi:hypothetical protein SUDANB105_07982 [Streptomyces sp. enrichment culture]
MSGPTYVITQGTPSTAAGPGPAGTASVRDNPVDALVRWAQLDQPHQSSRVLLERDGLPVDRPLRDLLHDASLHSTGDQASENRINGALTDWIRRHAVRNAIAGVAADGGADPLALVRAGWAWALRVDGAVPDGVLQRLQPEHRFQVDKGIEQMRDALYAAGLMRQQRWPLNGLQRHELYLHWTTLAGRQLPVGRCRPGPGADGPAHLLRARWPLLPPAGAPDCDLRTTAARIWWLTRDHQPEAAAVFHRVADPSGEADRPVRELFTALPEQLRHRSLIAGNLLAAAERLGSAYALHHRYSINYPGKDVARFRDDVQDASQLFVCEVTTAVVAASIQHRRPAPGARHRRLRKTTPSQPHPRPAPRHAAAAALRQRKTVNARAHRAPVKSTALLKQARRRHHRPLPQRLAEAEYATGQASLRPRLTLGC